jgi:hypothetical protein
MKMKDLCLETVPVASFTLMEFLVITWWLLLSQCLVGNVGNMLATCCTDMSMSANFPNIPFFCRHPFLPIWPFPCVLMSGNANISIVTESTTLQLSTHNYKNDTAHIITCYNIAPRGHLSSHKYQIS